MQHGKGVRDPAAPWQRAVQARNGTKGVMEIKGEEEL
jgi:hypothetical protein